MTTKQPNLNLPNTITVLRIFATPIVLWLLLTDRGELGPERWWGAILFIIFMASDAFDGYWARSRGLVTDLGKLLDPIADKVLTGGALVVLSILGELPWWVTIVVLIREIGITIHRLLAAHTVVLAAAWLGKVKTVLQSIAIPLAIVPHWIWTGEPGIWVNTLIMSAAVVMTIVSGIDYIVKLPAAKKKAE
ncbi:CDP-diacylglycerol--glycerol-3-phosphate 3-phosphatidyltransferase [Canibacter zhoujuaniae]|uniref:CDP-diacylglycerol--glycerol-3-phosphate 3-phosphatidyltransferase n=1 Tax=Canibacter zhoujuaniae TaxID=2708343 RepID=UPI00141F9128|nr:CDP-diacylglycerol--glycerol-3-phosphate 3-phosphatidyltransferase [Canibacter zhoujuaniae]